MKNPESLKNFITVGNAVEDAEKNNSNGWFIGHFMTPCDDLRCVHDVEVKWGMHLAGENKEIPAIRKKATTLAILISGSFALEFPEYNNSIVLETIGDYAIFAPGITHGWKALKDSVILTIRWPSISNDAEEVISTTPKSLSKLFPGVSLE